MTEEQRKIKPGDIVIITQNHSGHGFDIGETVLIQRSSSLSLVGKMRPGMKTGPNFTRRECDLYDGGKNKHFKLLLSPAKESL